MSKLALVPKPSPDLTQKFEIFDELIAEFNPNDPYNLFAMFRNLNNQYTSRNRSLKEKCAYRNKYFWSSDEFADFMEDLDETKRATAVSALGDIGKGNAQAMAALKKALGDSSANVRNAAKQALDKIEKESKKK